MNAILTFVMQCLMSAIACIPIQLTVFPKQTKFLTAATIAWIVPLLNVLNLQNILLLSNKTRLSVIINVMLIFAMQCMKNVVQATTIILPNFVNTLQMLLRIAVADAKIVQSLIHQSLKIVMQNFALLCLIIALIPMLPTVNTELMKLRTAVTTAWIVPLVLSHLLVLNMIIVSPIFVMACLTFASRASMILRNVVLKQIKLLIAVICAMTVIDGA
jgi:hypothetical protein